MKCRRAQQLLFDFFDGLSNETLRAELDRHIGECRECERFASEMSRSLSLLRRAPSASLDENFNWRVRLAIHRERTALRTRDTGSWVRAWNLRYAAGAGVAFALVLVAGVALQQSGMLDPGSSATVTSTAARDVPAVREVATRPSGAASLAQPSLVPRGASGTLVSDGGGSHSLVEGHAPLGAIDDPARTEAVMDSIFERQLVPLTPEQRAQLIERYIQRLQSRLPGQQPVPSQP
ncbi:MAG TPA: zf-HC2 domain-containing protein [Candidatus Krumholzibacteria bacterium]|nr:zf-HC2 domain-containing protein [Candidatus Krumholzibacteria bacterium]